MWEVIKANQRKSFFLITVMGILLIGLGFGIGYFYDPQGGGAFIGIIVALLIWLVMTLIAFSSGSSIMLSASNAKEVTPDVHPQLFNVVEEMSIAAGMRKMPKIYIIPTDAPNAFATGMNPDNAIVAVTAGLLARMNRDELQGVIAHEMSHIVNRDIKFMTLAGVMLGTIVIISEIFLRSMFLGAGRSRGKGGGQGQIVIMVIALVLAILTPIMAQLLYFAISRKREYLADASAVRLTRYPEGLASALEKISGSTEEIPMANKVTAPLYICNPLKKKGMKMSDLTSTHPPISERIRILRTMSGGAGLVNYQKAFNSVSGKNKTIIPSGELDNSESIAFREGSGVAAFADSKTTTRASHDIMMKMDKYSFINCNCGMKIKVPSNYASDKVYCTRCGKEHPIGNK
ncbi:MAG: M48 family metallopeptidase [Bacteroidales bacterium]|jgi:heat shock protein HtpX|nr:M48 family metallopeptidase [Bacteroidales bacterium]MDD4213949.1 M48 family metallopeptidase [Bacteroidales bacterium]